MKRPALLRADKRPAQPWKNGGGITREVAVFPAGAGMADFDWRISMAEVAEAGPFSLFEDVERVLTVLDGELDLTFDDQPGPIRLTSLSPPCPFAGDKPISGAPIGGPVRDLNVMVRRGRYAAKVERIELASGSPQTLDLPASCVLVALGAIAVRVGDRNYHLALDDAIRLECATSDVAVISNDDAGLIVIGIAAL